MLPDASVRDVRPDTSVSQAVSEGEAQMNLIELVFLLTCHEWKSCCAGLSHHKGPLRLQLVGREIKLVPAPSSMILQNMWIADGIRTIYAALD